MAKREMGVLRCVKGLSLGDYPRNEELRGKAMMECITEVIRKTKLRWCGPLVRRDDEETIKRA